MEHIINTMTNSFAMADEPPDKIDWERLDFIAPFQKTNTEIFQECCGKFPPELYDLLAQREVDEMMKAKKAFVLKHGLLIEQGKFRISFK